MSQLGLHRFEQRKTTVLAVLDHLGDVQLVDSGRRRRDRLLRFEVLAPGHAMAPEGMFIYAEWYQRVTRGWRRSRYQYDYLDRRHGGRLGYHWHSLIRRRGVYHAHCEERLGSPSINHYRSYEVDLLEAHEEFVRLYAADDPIDCASMRALI
ncbi:MAG: hypothetical protein ACRDGD_11035 [Candidatus Limnocylindria bacterium]